jgi:hypothetical protein
MLKAKAILYKRHRQISVLANNDMMTSAGRALSVQLKFTCDVLGRPEPSLPPVSDRSGIKNPWRTGFRESENLFISMDSRGEANRK